jgi:hypothetical protein
MKAFMMTDLEGVAGAYGVPVVFLGEEGPGQELGGFQGHVSMGAFPCRPFEPVLPSALLDLPGFTDSGRRCAWI